MATNTGVVLTRTTLAATLVYWSEAIHVPKCAPSATPETAPTQRVRPFGTASRLYAASGTSARAPRAHLQKAIARAGASVRRMKTAEAPTARTPTITAGSAIRLRASSTSARLPLVSYPCRQQLRSTSYKIAARLNPELLGEISLMLFTGVRGRGILRSSPRAAVGGIMLTVERVATRLSREAG